MVYFMASLVMTLVIVHQVFPLVQSESNRECTAGSHTRCSNLGLTSLRQITGNTTIIMTLTLNDNNITLTNDSFQNFTVLTSLYWRQNQLTSLPEAVFQTITSIVLIDLSNNSLTTLPGGVFNNLSMLTELRLGGNMLTSLPAGVFDDLHSLQYLHLQGNQLMFLRERVFQHLSNLQRLWLHQNQLTSLPKGVLRTLNKLTLLTMQSEIMDLDCENRCGVKFAVNGTQSSTLISSWTETNLCYGTTGKTYCSLGYCVGSNQVNESAVHVRGAGIGTLNMTANLTQYRVGIISCPVGSTAGNKTYTYCDRNVSKLAVPDNYVCMDVDECATGAHACHRQAQCTNSIGSYRCQCGKGWVGDGNTCLDTNECNDGSHDCQAQSECKNTLGSFTCKANEDLLGSGDESSGIDTCEDESHSCHMQAQCSNTNGSYICTCKEGWSGNGVKCTEKPSAFNTPAIIGGIVGGVVLLLGLVAALGMFKRMRKLPPSSTGNEAAMTDYPSAYSSDNVARV